MASGSPPYALGPSWGALALGLGCALALAAALALAIGLFSLRVQAIFFAMVTLAVAYAFNVLASQLPDLTGGEDGRSFRVPEILRPGYKLGEVPGARDHRAHAELLPDLSRRGGFVPGAAAHRQLAVRPRVAGDPRKPVPRRGARLPHRRSTARWRPSSRALGAAFAGALDAQWQRYVGPDTALSFSIQLDVLVIVVIGGRGTLWGAIVGAAVFVIAENYLRGAIGALSQAAASLGLPLLPSLLHPDRWLLWLGLLFILAVRFAPRGIVGELARRP